MNKMPYISIVGDTSPTVGITLLLASTSLGNGMTPDQRKQVKYINQEKGYTYE
jgi:hypothetical protein